MQINKAIFLVGCPGSGKDIILSKVLNQYQIKEFKLEQTVRALQENVKNDSLVISTNSNNLDKIKATKNILEEYGYETSLIYVEATNKVVKERLSKRNNIAEEDLNKKLKECKANKKQLFKLFDNFVLFNNNIKIEENPEINNILLFCEISLNQKYSNMFESKNLNKKILDKKSLKKSIKSSYPVDLFTKVNVDRIGNEFGVRDSGMGFPSTVGPFYSESFSEYEPEIPAFTSNSMDQRSVVPMDSYPEDRNVKTDLQKANRAIKKIKSIAKSSWKNTKR